jgi:hypothetical protein
MRRAWVRWVLLAACMLPAGPVSAGDSLRCGSRIVSVKALAAQVAAVCGEPVYVDRWEFDAPPYGGFVVDTEVWYYNFGANQLLRLLRFRNGRLVDVDTDGYGFNTLPDGSCSPSQIVDGESKYRLLLTCGEPIDRRGGSSLRPILPQSRVYQQYDHALKNDYVTPVYREEWTYNFGSSARQRTAILENGMVVDVVDGDRGFDP